MWYLIGMGISFFLLSLNLYIYLSKNNIKDKYGLDDQEATLFFIVGILIVAMMSAIWPMIFVSFLSFETFLLLKKWNKIPK